MAVEALDEVRATSPEPQENFWVMEVHRKEIKKCFRGEAALRSPAPCIQLLKHCADRKIDT